MRSLPAAAIGFPMLLTLMVVAALGYSRGTTISVLLFASAVVVGLIGIIRYICYKESGYVIVVIALLMSSVFAFNFTTELKNNAKLAACSDDTEGYARGTVVDIPGYDGTYRYVIKCDDGFTFLLNTSAETTAQMYDRFEGYVSFGASSEITIEQPIQAYGRIENLRFQPTHKKGLQGVVFNMRCKAIEVIDRHIPSQAGALVKGVLLGDETAFSIYLEQDFALTGLAHLLVVSGSHLSMFVVVMLLFLPLGINRRRLAWTLIFPMIFYMMLCGMGPSVVRAGICSAIFVLSYSVSREVQPLNSLGVSAIIVCIFWPQGAVSLGYLLSFYSTLGAILFYHPICSVINHTKLPKLIKIVLKPVVLTTTAQLFITPIILVSYSRITPVAVLSNLIIGGLVSILVAISAVAVVLSLTVITYPITYFICFGAEIISTLCIKLVDLMSKLSNANVVVSTGEIAVAMSIIACGMLIVLLTKKPKLIKTGVVVIVAGLITLTAFTYGATERVVVNKIDQNCVVIRYKDRTVAVGSVDSPKAKTFMTNAVYAAGDENTDVLALHNCDLQTAQYGAATHKAHCVLIPERITVKDAPYLQVKGKRVVKVADDFTVTAGDGYTCADMDGLRVVVAEEGANLDEIGKVDCIIAKGKCKGQSKNWVTFDNINGLAIGDGRVYNANGTEKFEFAVDRMFGIVQ